MFLAGGKGKDHPLPVAESCLVHLLQPVKPQSWLIPDCSIFVIVSIEDYNGNAHKMPRKSQDTAPLLFKPI